MVPAKKMLNKIVKKKTKKKHFFDFVKVAFCFLFSFKGCELATASVRQRLHQAKRDIITVESVQSNEKHRAMEEK